MQNSNGFDPGYPKWWRSNLIFSAFKKLEMKLKNFMQYSFLNRYPRYYWKQNSNAIKRTERVAKYCVAVPRIYFVRASKVQAWLQKYYVFSQILRKIGF